MDPTPNVLSSSGHLGGLDPVRVLGMAIGLETKGVPTDGMRLVPSLEDLSVLLPDYEIEALIGRGGMGAVYRAIQKKLGRTVAIKLLPVALGDEPGFADRFRREAMTTAGLVHPDIVAVFDTGETIAGHLYYVMEYVDGEDLAQRMVKGRLAVEESIALLAVVCGAVEEAHTKGIIHRDIKPSNILLTREGRPRLADFGLALLTERHLQESRLTMGGTTLGTLEYSAPEQLAGLGVTKASDLYSLGVLAYELLTGELPRGIFDPPSVRNPAVDSGFDGVVLRALQSDPARRYDSVADFRAALLNAADRREQHERRERESRRILRHRTLIAVMLLGVTLLTAGSAIFAGRAKHEANERRAAAETAEKETEGVIQFLLTDLRQRLEKTGNLAAMESVLERAVTHFRQKYEAANHSASTAAQLADALVVKGDVFAARGLPQEALDLFSEALSLAEKARNAEPNQPSRQLRLVDAWKRRSEQHLGMGRYDESLDDARSMLREAEKTRDPAAPLAAAFAHRAMANAHGYLKQMDESRAEYLKARDIFAAELKSHPGNQSLAADFADIDMSLGSVAETQGDFPRMLQHFTSWHEFVKASQGTNSNTYSHAAVRLAYALVLNKRADEALPLLTDAIRIAETEVDALPGHKGKLNQLRWCLEVFAKAQDQRGEGASAAEVRRRIEAINAAIAAAPDQEASGPQDRVAFRLEQAEKRLFDELKKNPENDEAQFAWAMSSEDVGKHTESEQGIPAAVKHYERQMLKLEPLLAAAPPETWWNLGTSYTLNRLGELQERTQNWNEAEPIFRRSLDLRRRTLANHPGNPREARNVASTASRLARCLIAQNRPAEADSLWRELLAELRPIQGSSSFEWRALVASSIEETLAALPPNPANSLAEATRDFLFARGEAAMSAAEKQCWERLDKTAGH